MRKALCRWLWPTQRANKATHWLWHRLACWRKAWLFSDTQAGAHASAVIYSLVETTKGFGFEPYLWLRYVLPRLPLAQTVEDYEALMPWNLHPQGLITQREI